MEIMGIKKNIIIKANKTTQPISKLICCSTSISKEFFFSNHFLINHCSLDLSAADSVFFFFFLNWLLRDLISVNFLKIKWFFFSLPETIFRGKKRVNTGLIYKHPLFWSLLVHKCWHFFQVDCL